MIHGEISFDFVESLSFPLSLSLSLSLTFAHLPRGRFPRDQTRGSAIATALPCPLLPGPAWCRVLPSKRGLYLAPMRPINPFIHFATCLGNGNLGSAADWQRVGKNCQNCEQRTRRPFSFPLRPARPPLPPRWTDGRTDGLGVRLPFYPSLICEHSARISLLHGALYAAGRGRSTY